MIDNPSYNPYPQIATEISRVSDRRTSRPTQVELDAEVAIAQRCRRIID